MPTPCTPPGGDGTLATAAKHHVRNVAQADAWAAHIRDLPQPSDEWVGRENLAIDLFPIPATPISRRGRFAWYVARTRSILGVTLAHGLTNVFLLIVLPAILT